MKNLNAALQSEKASKLSYFLLFVCCLWHAKIASMMHIYQPCHDGMICLQMYELLRLQAARTALEKQLEEDLKKAWLMSFFFGCF